MLILTALPFGGGVRNEIRRGEEAAVEGSVDNAGINGKVCPAIRYLKEVIQTAG